MGLPLLTEKNVIKIWTTMTLAEYDGDVQVMLALRSILEWRTTAWWRSRSFGGMAWDPNNVQRWKHKVGFHNRRIQWDTPMARWAGEGNEWIQPMTQTKPRREDVIRNLLESTKQPVDKKKESKGHVPTKKPRDLPSLDLGTPVPGKRPTLGRGMHLRQRTTDWVTHTFREHNKEADLWAGNGARVREKNRWTPLALCGKRLPLYVDSGTESTTTANAGVALSSWPSRNHTDGSLSTKNVALYQGTVPWMLKWADV